MIVAAMPLITHGQLGLYVLAVVDALIAIAYAVKVDNALWLVWAISAVVAVIAAQ